MVFLAVAGAATSILLHFRLRDVPLRSRGDGEQVPWRRAVAAMRSTMMVLAALNIVRSMMAMSVTVFLPLFLTEEGANVWVAGAALSIVEAAGIAGALAGGWVSDQVGRRAVLIFGHIAAPSALLLFLAADGVVRIALLPVIGFTLLALPPVFMALVQERFSESRALANGVYLSINFAVRSVAAIAFGIVGDAFGLSAAMQVAAFATFGGLPLIWVLFRRSD
jgi:FSR family fosmidomycin resistance protein-like MFS transporter